MNQADNEAGNKAIDSLINYETVKVSSIADTKRTVKFLNFRTPEIFAVIYLKFKQRGRSLRYFVKSMQME